MTPSKPVVIIHPARLHPDRQCPSCRATLEAMTRIDDGKVHGRAPAVSICGFCGALFMVENEARSGPTFRLPTLEETMDIRASDQWPLFNVICQGFRKKAREEGRA